MSSSGGRSSAKAALGRQGEDAAAVALAREGYRILARNHGCRRGEIDIVAEEGDCLCFVEVRTRGGGAVSPAETVDRSKQRRVVAAARDWLYRHPSERSIRFDVASVRRDAGGNLQVELLRNAFDAGE
ncbi:MAG: YraN family protein [Myxococcales bacterium]